MSSSPSQDRTSPPSSALSHAAERGSFERVAGWLGAACAVHCLAVPVASALVPLMGASGGAMLEGADPVLSSLVVLGGGLSLVLGYMRHRDVRIAGAMLLCIALYLLGHTLEGAWYGSALAVLAGLGLSAASFVSARSSHAHDAHCGHSH